MFTLTNYKSPTSQLGRVSYAPLIQNFDSLLNQLFNYNQTSFNSRIKLNETDSQWSLTLELPGYSSKDAEVSVEDKTLHVKAKLNDRETNRELSLWEGIAFEKVSGSMKDGLLTVNLPKVEKVKPRKIEIK
jgi:HSP20 family protein